jgi:hypothetical protein
MTHASSPPAAPAPTGSSINPTQFSSTCSRDPLADHVVNVLSGDDIRALPNANAAEAVARIAGVSTERDEGVAPAARRATLTSNRLTLGTHRTPLHPERYRGAYVLVRSAIHVDSHDVAVMANDGASFVLVVAGGALRYERQ